MIQIFEGFKVKEGASFLVDNNVCSWGLTHLYKKHLKLRLVPFLLDIIPFCGPVFEFPFATYTGFQVHSLPSLALNKVKIAVIFNIIGSIKDVGLDSVVL